MSEKRLIFRAPGSVEAEGFDPGVPGAGEVGLKTVVTAISAGTESLLWHGTWPDEMPLDGVWAPERGSAAYPVAYGYAAVGRVETAGPDVDAGLIGRLAFSFTGHQSAAVLPLANIFLLPVGVDAEDGVFLASMETALSLAQDAAPVTGEHTGVWGLGIIGILTATLLARSGAVTAWDLAPLRREKAAAFGAASVRRPEPASCDVVVELTGNPAALDEALAATRFAGRVVVGSWYGSSPVAVSLGGDFHRSRIELISSQVSTLSPSLSGRWTKKRRLETALALVAELKPSRLVTHRFTLDQANAAYTQACDTPTQGLQVLFRY